MKKSALILLTAILTNSLFPMLSQKKNPKKLEIFKKDFYQRFKNESKKSFETSEDQINIEINAYALKCDKTRNSMVQFIKNLKSVVKNSKKN